MTGPGERTPNAGPGGPTIPGRLARLEAERVADRGQQVQQQAAIAAIDTRLRRIETMLEKLTTMVDLTGQLVERGDGQLVGMLEQLTVMTGVLTRQAIAGSQPPWPAAQPPEGTPDTGARPGHTGEDPAR
jgi:hypothetical protein